MVVEEQGQSYPLKNKDFYPGYRQNRKESAEDIEENGKEKNGDVRDCQQRVDIRKFPSGYNWVPPMVKMNDENGDDGEREQKEKNGTECEHE